MIINLKNFKYFCKKNINNNIYALFGFHLSHSLSQELHNYINQENFNNKKNIYILVNIKKKEFSKSIKLSKKYLCGFNLTMPYKQTIIKYLDKYDKNLISINTVKIINKKLIGYNTDIYGFIYIINEKKISLNYKTIIIFGYGSLAQTIINYILSKYYNSIIFVCTRSPKQLLNKKNLLFISYDNIPKFYDIIINCTPIGMYPLINEKLPINKISSNASCIIDTIYNPLQTSLIKLSIKNNIKKYSNGLNMFIIQAIYANNIWHKKYNIPINTYKYNIFLKKLLIQKKIYIKKNIIICGFTSVGKSTIGLQLSKILQKKFIDTDDIIEKVTNINIKKIFKYFGELFFRRLENNLINYIINKHENSIISLGGGSMNQNINDNFLFKNYGLIIFLYSKYKYLIKNILKNKKNSPMLNKNLELIFYQRLNTYINNSNIIINLNFQYNIDYYVNLILEML